MGKDQTPASTPTSRYLPSGIGVAPGVSLVMAVDRTTAVVFNGDGRHASRRWPSCSTTSVALAMAGAVGACPQVQVSVVTVKAESLVDVAVIAF